MAKGRRKQAKVSSKNGRSPSVQDLILKFAQMVNIEVPFPAQSEIFRKRRN